jgi:hypothetical protein
VHLGKLGIEAPGEPFAQEQTLLHVDPIAFASRRPAHVVGRIGPRHMGQEDGDR